jgi:hypothetical protein
MRVWAAGGTALSGCHLLWRPVCSAAGFSKSTLRAVRMGPGAIMMDVWVVTGERRLNEVFLVCRSLSSGFSTTEMSPHKPYVSSLVPSI